MALGVVANVDEQLVRMGRHADPVEQATCRSPLLGDDRVLVLSASICVPHGVGAAIGDSREQRLRSERPVDAAPRGKTVSSYAAHVFYEKLSL